MKIFLDDIRSAPAGYAKVDCYSDCIRMLEKNKGNVEEISLDYYLDDIRTGYDVCRWLIDNEYWDGLNHITLHSSSPYGIKKMLQILDDNAPSYISIGYLDINRNYIPYSRE